MRAETSIIRSSSDRSIPRDVFIAEPRPPHRPRLSYTVQLDTAKKVELARRAGLPVSLFGPKVSDALGYPLAFKPALLLDRSLIAKVTTIFRVIPFLDAAAARAPTLEDYIVAMLWIDVLGARRIAMKNRGTLDGARLLKRILQEDLEARAWLVRMNDLARGLPRVPGVRQVSRRALAGSDRRDFGTTAP